MYHMLNIRWLAVGGYVGVDVSEPSIQRFFTVEGEVVRFIFHGLDVETVLVIGNTFDKSYFAQDNEVESYAVL